MLRAASRLQITSVLEESFFGIANYSVQFLDGGKNIVVIGFVPERRFQFVVGRPDEEGAFPIVETPGERFLTADSYYRDSFDGILDSLTGWTVRLRDEVVASNPFARELSSLKEQMDKRLDELSEDVEGFFSADEAADWKVRLESFESKLDELVVKNAELETAVSNMRGAIQDLQSSIDLVDKKTWFRMSAGRMLTGLRAIATSKEARELALEAAKKFLLEAPK